MVLAGVLCATLLAAAVAASSLVALTPPESGAVARPDGLDLSWPFTAGTRVYITAGYGPGAGSSLHAGTNRGTSANDYHALDLTLPDHPNGGLGQPVTAIAAGTVVRAGWATSGWRNYGQRVILRHDFNGHSYHSLYAHLHTVAVREGDRVDKGQRLGDLGGSCDGDNQVLDCPSFGPHLHFSLHEDSQVGGSGTGGSYGGRAVVPEPMDGAEDLRQGQTHTSRNDGGPLRPCIEIDGETILEEDGPCGLEVGPPEYWHDHDGHGGHSLWTYTIDDPAPDNWVLWQLHFAQGGRYEVAAYIPDNAGDSERAPYRIRHDGREVDSVGNQSASRGGWLQLGSYDFAAGGDQWIKLRDNTGEPYTDENGTKISFDAIRIRPVRDDPPDTGMDSADAPEDTRDAAIPNDISDPEPDVPGDVPELDAESPDTSAADSEQDRPESDTEDGNRVRATSEGCQHTHRAEATWWPRRR